MPTFNEFNLQPATREALAIMEITEPTPIQAEAIPALLAGNDLVGQSATGSGKTLAYGVPLVERLARDKRVVQALVLLPTRELAVQVHAVLGMLATSRRLTTALLVGGRPYASQIAALRHGSQIVIGTPGRVKDLLDRGNLVLSELRMCVLDEADQMLDIGFAPVIEEILTTTPETRQTALFSATMPDWIAKLEKKFLKNPVKVDTTVSLNSIEQIAYQVPQEQKMAALCTLLQSAEGESSLIFGRTKYGVEKLGKQLSKLGFTVGTLHGNKSQRAREEVLMAFRRGHVQTLLATNVAARGLDIQGIYQVINYELPESSDLFTHRIGRTGRMGRQGKAITLLVPSDMPKWRIMARNLGQKVALQRLTIDEETTNIMSTPRSETPTAQVHEKNGEKQPKPDRKHSTSDQRPGGEALSKQDSPTVSGAKRRQKDSVTSGATARRPVSQPERSFSSKERYGRRGVGRQPSFARNTGERKVHAFVASEPQYRTTRRKPRAASAGRLRHEGASNRSASR
ncbi:MAG TPA: DEAD/DEAH box helicase [Ktedonobacteraceae bacterium]|nr:DEAD/DEAH box helicase [Ktedonobacteraceae bacterium]